MMKQKQHYNPGSFPQNINGNDANTKTPSKRHKTSLLTQPHLTRDALGGQSCGGGEGGCLDRWGTAQEECGGGASVSLGALGEARLETDCVFVEVLFCWGLLFHSYYLLSHFTFELMQTTDSPSSERNETASFN